MRRTSRRRSLRLGDLLFALAGRRGDPVAVYDHLAPRYERVHGRWLRAGGAEALAALEGCLAAELRPGARVLDAACGTGALARWIAEHEPRARLTMLDAAPGMLARAAAVPGRRVQGDLGALPFADGAFDIVTCAWGLETLADPARGLSELGRVLAPGGLLAYCFCTAPRRWSVRARSLPMRLAVEHVFGGRFLRADFSPGLDGARARRVHGRLGLSTFVCYRKPAAAGAGRR
ncbi:MAG TPA: methyltransferase domain-containing protein [Thermodesulfobacteriota bacterium]